MKTHVIASLKKVASIVALNLFVASGAFAATTTLNFEITPGPLTNQYDGQGVNVLGTQVITASDYGLPPRSGTRVATSEVEGKTTAIFSPSIGSVQSVTAYILSSVDIGMYAYTANGTFITSSSVSPSQSGGYVALSVVSPSIPIAYVEIHNHGGSFFIDDFSFVTPDVAPVPVCEVVNQNLYNSFKAIPDSLYKVPKTAPATRTAGLKLISVFDASLKSDVSNKVLLAQLAVIRAGADCALKPSPQKTQVLQLIDDLIAKTKAGKC
jgi:hypothetical protein